MTCTGNTRARCVITLLMMTTWAAQVGATSASPPIPDEVKEHPGVTLTGPKGAQVTWLGASAPVSTKAGVPFEVEVVWRAARALPSDSWVFVHVESDGSSCRVIQDQPAAAPNQGLIRHRVSLTVPTTEACKPQRLEVRAGVYQRGGGGRYRVEEGHSADDRLHVGYLGLVSDDADASRRWTTPSAMAWQRWIAASRPWWGWIFGWATALGLLSWMRRRRSWEVQLQALPRAASLWLSLAVAGVAVFFILVAIDFVKDDAYISFRYAHNVVSGRGLVFNGHDHLEGITNLLWTLVLVPFEALGMDLFQVTEILGTLLVLWTLWSMSRITTALGAATPGAQFWPGLAIASSSSAVLWATSGMEQPLAIALPMASAAALWTTWRSDDKRVVSRGAWIAGTLAGLGCLTRPDIHLIALVLGLPPLWRALKSRALDRALLGYAAGVLLITVPGHGFRYLYFGEWLPNTYYVKTGGGVLVWLRGLKALHEMWDFNHIGWLAMIAPLAFIRRDRTAEKLSLAAVSLGYMAYIVKVGRDEMHWHRLYLPALPSLALLAGLGLSATLQRLTPSTSGAWTKRTTAATGWTLVIAMVVSNGWFTWRHQGGLNGRGDLSGNYHPDMGKFVTRHTRPGGLVAFQDMGSTPYHAPDLDFFDFIGLTDRVVARTRHRYGLHPFVETSAQRHQRAFDAQMRGYFHTQRPEWVILTSYVHGAKRMERVAKRFEKYPVPESLGYSVGSNRYQFGVYDDEFKRRYVHVRTWPRSRGYYLSLFYLRSLWDEVPREVVWTTTPEGVGGPKARFARGVELIGATLPKAVPAKQEFYLDLTWRVDGPLESDWWVFVHLERPGYRHPVDHVPGDWMWPADRWRKGDVIADRSLVQLPPFMAPGRYEVWLGMYRRSTWERLGVLEGPKDAQNRVHVGSVEVQAQVPLWDHLIRPTRVDEDRRWPERIIDHGRDPKAYAERAAQAVSALTSQETP